MRRLVLTSLALVLAGASSGQAATITVTIEKMLFTPAEVTARVGDTIEWTNKDFVAHTATARDKSFDVIVPAHGSGSLVVQAPGSFDYFCRFHPMMKGKVTAEGN